MQRDPINELLKQISIALLALAMDFVVYNLLLILLPLSVHVLKGASFLVSGGLAGVAHFIWNDASDQASVVEKLTIFMITLAVNVGVNYTALVLLPITPQSLLFAFLIAATCTLAFDFLRIRRHYVHEYLLDRNREQFVQRNSNWVEISRRRANEE